MDYQFETPVKYLKGVGPQLGARLEGWGVHTLEDLVHHIPRTYQHWKKVDALVETQGDESVIILATLINLRSFRRGYQKSFELVLEDRRGQKFYAKYFRQPFHGYFERFRCPQKVWVMGKVQLTKNKIEFHHPDILDEGETLDHQNQLVPVYTETTGLNSRKIHKLVDQCFRLLDRPLAWQPKELLPSLVCQKYQLIPRQAALKQLHFPAVELKKEYEARRTPGHRRLIFEDFFWMEFALAMKKKDNVQEKATPYVGTGKWRESLRAALPFCLTQDQEKAIQEIEVDLQQTIPMNRLLQGDVGSGKTIVMFFSLLPVLEAGGQAALMAPTEILSEQHYQNAQRLLEKIPIKMALLTSKTKSEEKKQILLSLKEGALQLIIGTHSLIEDEVQFAKLGLVMIDEQHRFGVGQRYRLQSKGISLQDLQSKGLPSSSLPSKHVSIPTLPSKTVLPHRLMVTATPIPRTLAMTAYGDLEVSILREKPPGRTPITSKIMEEKNRGLMMTFLMKQIEAHRQAYFVYPLVEESEKVDLKSALESYEAMKAQYPQVRWGLLHGKMKPSEKEEVMRAFRQNQIQILVSTTVIEVGVDVPNAVIMIIEHSERFGLSQLHQLRGRVGRGALKSFCIFVAGTKISREAKQRLTLMCETEDGFRIAEADLKWRGAGEFLGAKQSGVLGFRWADLILDEDILAEARSAVHEIFATDPDLKTKDHQKLVTHWQSLPSAHTS